MTINAGTVSNVDVSNVGSVRRKNDNSSGDLFASIMNVSISQRDNQELGKGDSSDVIAKDNNSYDKDSYSVTNDVKKDVKSDRTDKNDNMDKVDEKSQLDSDEHEILDEVSDEVVAEEITMLDPFVVAVKETIQENYDLSDEEFSGLLERVDVAIEQLTDVNVVSDVVADLENITKVDLLIDQSQSDKLQTAVDDIMMQAELSVTADDSGVENDLAESGVADLMESSIVDENKQMNHIDYDNQTVNTAIDDNEMANVDASTKDDFKESDSKSSQYEAVESNLSDALNRVIGNENVEEVGFEENVNGADIVRQVVDEIKVNNTREVSSIELKLNPENLGKVSITVESKNGVMQAKIVAETEAAEKAIVAGMETLKDAFNSQELKVDAIEVMLAPHSFFEDAQGDAFEGGHEENASADNGNGNVLGDMSATDEEEEADIILQETIRNTVSYMA